MALDPIYSAVQSAARDKITVYDNTGVFHSTDRPGGWGGLNPSVSNVTTAGLVLTIPDPTTLAVSLDPASVYQFTVYPTLPNTVGTGYNILPASIGLLSSDKIPDGMYDFSIKIQGVWNPGSGDVGFTYTYHWRQVFINGYGCCVDKSFASVSELLSMINCEPCKNKAFKVLMLGLGYDGIVLNNNCAKPNQSLDILKIAQPMCEDCGCGCN